MTSLRARVRADEPLIGTFCAVPHPTTVEMVAGAGFDFLCLDAEHSAMDRATIESLVRAADAGGVPALVRVAGHAPELIGAALDSGARGVLVPRVNTAEQARQAVAATRYPPLGARGAGPGRASRYGADLGGYLARANDELLLAVQVETEAAVENVEDIAAVEGVDLVFVGPGDLAVSLGIPSEPTAADTERLQTAITSVIDACTARGRAVGLFRPTADDVSTWRSKGAALFVIAADSVFLMTAAATGAAAARAGLEGRP